MMTIVRKTPFGAVPNLGNVQVIGQAPLLERLLTSYLNIGIGSKTLSDYYLNAIQIVYCMGMYEPLANIKSYDGISPKIKSLFLKSGQLIAFPMNEQTSKYPPNILYEEKNNGQIVMIDQSYFQSVIDFFYQGSDGSFALDSLLVTGIVTPSEERSFPELFSLISANFSKGTEQQTLLFLVHLLNLAKARVVCLEQFFDFTSVGTFRKPFFTVSYEQARSYALPLSKAVDTELLSRKPKANDYFSYEALFQLFFASLTVVQLQKAIRQVKKSDKFKNANAKIGSFLETNPIVEQLRLLSEDLDLNVLIPQVLAIQLMCLNKLQENLDLVKKTPPKDSLNGIFGKLPNLQGIFDTNTKKLKDIFLAISNKVMTSYDNKAWVKNILKPVDAKNVVGREDIVFNEANCSLKSILELPNEEIGAQILIPKNATYMDLLATVFGQYTESPMTPFTLVQFLPKDILETANDISPNALYLYSILSFYTLQCYISKTCGLVGSAEEVVGLDRSIGTTDVLMGEKNKETLLDLFIGVGLGSAIFGIFVLGNKIYKQNQKNK